MGPAMPLPLPWPLLRDYGDRLGLCPDDRATMERVLKALDAKHIELEVARMRQDAEASAARARVAGQ